MEYAHTTQVPSIGDPIGGPTARLEMSRFALRFAVGTAMAPAKMTGTTKRYHIMDNNTVGRSRSLVVAVELECKRRAKEIKYKRGRECIIYREGRFVKNSVLLLYFLMENDVGKLVSTT